MSLQINLLNLQLQPRKDYFSALNLVRIFIAIVLLLVLLQVFFYFQIASLKKAGQQSAQQLQQSQTQVAQLRLAVAALKHDAELTNAIRAAEENLSHHQEVLHFLQTGTGHTPILFSNWMQAFARQIPEGVALTGFDLYENGDLALFGKTRKPEFLAIYVRQLSREASLKGISFSSMQMNLPEVSAIASEQLTGSINQLPEKSQNKVQDKADKERRVENTVLQFALRSSNPSPVTMQPTTASMRGNP